MGRMIRPDCYPSCPSGTGYGLPLGRRCDFGEEGGFQARLFQRTDSQGWSSGSWERAFLSERASELHLVVSAMENEPGRWGRKGGRMEGRCCIRVHYSAGISSHVNVTELHLHLQISSLSILWDQIYMEVHRKFTELYK